MRSPVQGLMAKAEIKDFQQLKSKKVAVSSPGSTTDLATRYTLRREGLELGRDYSTVYVASEAGRLAALDAGIVDAAMLPCRRIFWRGKQVSMSSLFPGTIYEFPQNGFGASTKKIKENPDEIYRMVRGTLRGLMYVSDKNNKDACLDMIAKHWSAKMRMSPVAATRFGECSSLSL
jgi:ABC-type nitrate/sulfonate/bicarbonate transport system substrate-binding protein